MPLKGCQKATKQQGELGSAAHSMRDLDVLEVFDLLHDEHAFLEGGIRQYHLHRYQIFEFN